MFQITSFKSSQIVEQGFMPTFKIQGQVYHLAGSLLPHLPDDHELKDKENVYGDLKKRSISKKNYQR